eukprot:TRINITY_DN2801_c0_g2_i1.p1 TRINITY_DN2801_c0_g2~~TRINITY_DN2801_c0_g2_i1.p1  ORF type:complete len:124 (+),score=23.19 TRINITY_DN2801_c0_g2_i1:174-545(+)
MCIRDSINAEYMGTYKMKNSVENCSTILQKIKKIQIPELGEKGSLYVMRLIAKCLKYSPCTRFNMKDVLLCLVHRNNKFPGIFCSLSDEMKLLYSKEIHKLIALSNMMPKKRKQFGVYENSTN